MSRTFRRKGYEAKQGSIQGGKVAGYYTIKEGGWWRWNKKPVLFREPTRQEYYEQFWKLHGDSHRNHGCLYVSDWIKPCGKFWKRQASKRFRKVRSAGSYGFYKKTFGWFAWS